MTLRLLFFLVLNFGGLYLGSLYTSSGVSSDWYTHLAKAPWTPPGWVFGAAWSVIMLCFSVYLAFLWRRKQDSVRFLTSWYACSLLLNIAWNPLFFELRWIAFALVSISILTLLIWFGFFRFRKEMGRYTLLILPYGIWLLIATSLNAYILLMN